MQKALFTSLVSYRPGYYLLRASARKDGVKLGLKISYRDQRYGGMYVVKGTVKVAGSPDVPVVRRVLLFNLLSSCFLARAVWSSSDGSYRFDNVGRGPWFVTSHDHTGEYNAVIADNIVAEPM